MEPEEFAAMVTRIRQLEAALGDSQKRITDEEQDSAIIMRRSLHAAKPLAAGEEITADKLVSLRPAIGIPPKFLEDVVGRRSSRSLEAKEAISWTDLS
jgi:sialic acid synthase SpsE